MRNGGATMKKKEKRKGVEKTAEKRERRGINSPNAGIEPTTSCSIASYHLWT